MDDVFGPKKLPKKKSLYVESLMASLERKVRFLRNSWKLIAIHLLKLL